MANPVAAFSPRDSHLDPMLPDFFTLTTPSPPPSPPTVLPTDFPAERLSCAECGALCGAVCGTVCVAVCGAGFSAVCGAECGVVRGAVCGAVCSAVRGAVCVGVCCFSGDRGETRSFMKNDLSDFLSPRFDSGVCGPAVAFSFAGRCKALGGSWNGAGRRGAHETRHLYLPFLSRTWTWKRRGGGVRGGGGG